MVAELADCNSPRLEVLRNVNRVQSLIQWVGYNVHFSVRTYHDFAENCTRGENEHQQEGLQGESKGFVNGRFLLQDIRYLGEGKHVRLNTFDPSSERDLRQFATWIARKKGNMYVIQIVARGRHVTEGTRGTQLPVSVPIVQTVQFNRGTRSAVWALSASRPVMYSRPQQ